MTESPDFEFSFGKDKHLRGWGWRGLLALAFLLVAIVAVFSLCGPVIWQAVTPVVRSATAEVLSLK
jgi:hypothetical protein